MEISKRASISALSAIAVVTAIGASVWYFTYQSIRDLEIQASQAIVAWVFEDQPIPGFEEVIQVVLAE